LLARTCRQLSEKHTLLTVFVKAFKNMSILYHVRTKKSNVFLHRTKYFFRNQKTIDKPVNLCLNVTNMKKTLTENSSFQKSSQRAGGWCEPVWMERSI